MASRKKIFFDTNNNPKLSPNTRGKIRLPNTKNLKELLGSSDMTFVDFIEVYKLDLIFRNVLNGDLKIG
jgi:dual specificity tyrosine-phosphorylation-regulated kinase 2/3/4